MFPDSLIKRFHRTSFRNKLVLTYVLLIVIPVFSALFIYGTQLYRQTTTYYEDILEQLNQRTNVTIDDFFTNLARNSFFYLTDTKLHNIMDKALPSSDKQYLSDSNYMQNAMEQFVLINGNIAMIYVQAPNGSLYGSKSDKANQLLDTLKEIGREKLRESKMYIHVPKAFDMNRNSGNQSISIVRYLSDLNLNNGREAYAQIDIYYKSIENMLGGISVGDQKLRTIVLAGDRVIYNSDGRSRIQSASDNEELIAGLAKMKLTQEGSIVSNLRWNGEHYMVSGSLNRVTGWTVLQFIPSDRITNTFIGNTVSYALFGILALIAALALAFFFHRYFANPILKLSGAMKMVDTGNLHNVTVKTDREDEIGRLIMSYNVMIERLKSSRASEIAAGQQQKKAELKMLQAQINPHFLYNTLNAIHSISELHRIDTISTMTKSLSSLYRYNIKYGDEVTVAKELEQIDNYVKIQQIRFLNRFQVEYRVDPEVLSYKILKFLMQPIIENSFYHGLEPKGGQGLLTLTIKRQGQFLHIEVKDNGAGIAPEKLAELTAMLEEDGAATGEDADSGRHFGLRNVHTRIKHFYGDGYWMRVHSREEEGTTIEMNIPLSKEDERP